MIVNVSDVAKVASAYFMVPPPPIFMSRVFVSRITYCDLKHNRAAIDACAFAYFLFNDLSSCALASLALAALATSDETITLPKGAKDTWASLKCARPKGMPMIVMQ